jgi:hypothetical protein
MSPERFLHTGADMPKCLTIGLALVLTAMAQRPGAQSSTKPPETFVAVAQVASSDLSASANLTIYIDSYTTDRDRTRMTEALKINGYPGFLPALRKAPSVGHVEMNDRKILLRWATQQTTEKGRKIVVVAESPLFFLGGARVDAKPREGFELAVIQMDVDTVGLGTGMLAAAARVRPAPPDGVQVDEYADQLIKLTTVRKSYR